MYPRNRSTTAHIRLELSLPAHNNASFCGKPLHWWKQAGERNVLSRSSRSQGKKAPRNRSDPSSAFQKTTNVFHWTRSLAEKCLWTDSVGDETIEQAHQLSLFPQGTVVQSRQPTARRTLETIAARSHGSGSHGHRQSARSSVSDFCLKGRLASTQLS